MKRTEIFEDCSEERLARTLRAFVGATEALTAASAPAEMLATTIRFCVPALFSAMRVVARAVSDVPDLQLGSIPPGVATISYDLNALTESYGTLTVAEPGDRPFDEIDADIARDLAARIAFALYVARAIARDQRVANTLQRALLPNSLPRSDRVTASAAYLPGTDEAIVGGDWYDVFDLPDGRMAFSIGDVAGHGLDAAVVMGEVRQAFRAAAVNATSPSLVLDRANTIVAMRDDTAIVTAVFGILNRETSTITYAVAGHPPPILATPDGSAQMLPARGIPLGIDESLGTRDWTLTLPPGAMFALYTDGLTEHSRDVAAGEVELLEAMRDEVRVRSAQPAQAIVDRIFRARKNADDVAVLVLAVDPMSPPRFSFEFSALPVAVPIMRHALLRYLAHEGITGDDAYSVALAVGEAAANAVEHAYASDEVGLVAVRAERRDDALVVDVLDAGRWKPIERRDERGRGIKIMRALMDRIEIHTMQAETNVRMTVRIPRDNATRENGVS